MLLSKTPALRYNYPMRFEHLISCVDKNVKELGETMHLSADAVIVNQCSYDREDSFDLVGHKVYEIDRDRRGVGLSRNTALEAASADIVLFGDEDIVYEADCAEKVLSEFEAHPDADLILFNVKVCDERRTYWNDSFGRVYGFNSGRYPAYSIAAKRAKLMDKGIRFSLYFGGGAKYSNGEDSLFLRDAARAGLKMFKSPILIGEEIPRPSTWFTGYNEKFFYDRGVLYRELYGRVMAPIRAFRWLFKNRKEFCAEFPYKEARKLMKKGYHDGVKTI